VSEPYVERRVENGHAGPCHSVSLPDAVRDTAFFPAPLKWVSTHPTSVPVSFDLFGTLVAVERPADPAAALGRELADCGVRVPEDWADAYAESHGSTPQGRERPLAGHVEDALASRGVDAPRSTVASAVRGVFAPEAVRTREGALAAVAAARTRGPVGVCSNCSVDGLVERTLAESQLDRTRFDAVVASVDCGWRKPDRRAFVAVADALDVEVASLVHVGDDPDTDGGVTAAGGTFLRVGDGQLASLAGREGWPC
jgi:FMN phosphatase YigB (HAD superfamily)